MSFWPEEYYHEKPKKKREKGFWDLLWRILLIPVTLTLVAWVIIELSL